MYDYLQTKNASFIQAYWELAEELVLITLLTHYTLNGFENIGLDEWPSNLAHLCNKEKRSKAEIQRLKPTLKLLFNTAFTERGLPTLPKHPELLSGEVDDSMVSEFYREFLSMYIALTKDPFIIDRKLGKRLKAERGDVENGELIIPQEHLLTCDNSNLLNSLNPEEYSRLRGTLNSIQSFVPDLWRYELCSNSTLSVFQRVFSHYKLLTLGMIREWYPYEWERIEDMESTIIDGITQVPWGSDWKELCEEIEDLESQCFHAFVATYAETFRVKIPGYSEIRLEPKTCETEESGSHEGESSSIISNRILSPYYRAFRTYIFLDCIETDELPGTAPSWHPHSLVTICDVFVNEIKGLKNYSRELAWLKGDPSLIDSFPYFTERDLSERLSKAWESRKDYYDKALLEMGWATEDRKQKKLPTNVCLKMDKLAQVLERQSPRDIGIRCRDILEIGLLAYATAAINTAPEILTSKDRGGLKAGNTTAGWSLFVLESYQRLSSSTDILAKKEIVDSLSHLGELLRELNKCHHPGENVTANSKELYERTIESISRIQSRFPLIGRIEEILGASNGEYMVVVKLPLGTVGESQDCPVNKDIMPALLKGKLCLVVGGKVEMMLEEGRLVCGEWSADRDVMLLPTDYRGGKSFSYKGKSKGYELPLDVSSFWED